MTVGIAQAFKPGLSLPIAASTTSASVGLMKFAGDSILVTNTSASWAYVALGASGVVAAVGYGVPVPPGGRTILAGGDYSAAVAVVLASGTGSVVISQGSGSAY